MHYYSTLLAVAPLVAMARAGIEFDLNDTPDVCKETCRPISDLSRTCNVDLPDRENDRDDRTEDQLELQCFCSNTSFDVGGVVASCKDCIRQNRRNNNNNNNNNNDDHDDNDGHDDHDMKDQVNVGMNDNDNGRDDDGEDSRDNDRNDNDRDDDGEDSRDNDRNNKRDDNNDAWDDIEDIIRSCSFTQTTSWSSATTSAASVIVSATPLTASSQLTTTFIAGPAPTGNNAPTQTNAVDPASGTVIGDDQGAGAAGVNVPVYLAAVAGVMVMFA